MPSTSYRSSNRSYARRHTLVVDKILCLLLMAAAASHHPPGSRTRGILFAHSFSVASTYISVMQKSKRIGNRSPFLPSSNIVTYMSDWSTFEALEDDDDAVIAGKFDTRDYALEEDSQTTKAEVGKQLEPPSIDRPAPPIDVPAGSQLELSEETVLGILSACRNELGTLFGYTAENRGVGITGGVDYVDMDGPVVIVRLKGRFWHQRTTVLERVANYLQQRIPEIIDVEIEDPYQLTDEANDVW